MEYVALLIKWLPKILIENTSKFQSKYIPHHLRQHMGYFQVWWKNLVVVQEHCHLPCSEQPKVLIFASELQVFGLIPCLNPSFKWCISKLVQSTLTNKICKHSILSVWLKFTIRKQSWKWWCKKILLISEELLCR